MKKIIALILVMITALSVVACGGGGTTVTTTEPTVTDAPAISPSDTTDSSVTSAPEEKLEIPEGKFDDAEFVVISAGQVAYDDFSFTDAGTEVLDQAQYMRKTTVEDLLGVVINIVIDENKSGVGNGSGYKRVSRAVDANDADYHIGLIGGMDVSTLAYSSYLVPLAEAKYMDLEKSWWDQNANTDLQVMGNIFFTQGDITAAKSDCTYVIFYNKALGREELNGEDPYKLVLDKKWTLDKFAELCLAVSEDLDGNGTMDMEDRYGLYAWDDSILGMISAAGQKVASINADGEFELTIYNDKVLSVIEKFGNVAYNTDYAIQYQRYSNNGNVREKWTNDQALFWATSTFNTSSMREMDSDFGILPFPMLNSEQTRYYSTIPTYNSQFLCLPSVQEDMDFTSIVTEALAYYGRTIVRPAVYEKTIKGTYFRDEESIAMLDIIYDSFIYDIGQLHRIGNMNSLLLNMFRAKESNFASIYAANSTIAEQQIKAVNNGYRKVIDSWAD
ncbi:MAG: hypothetical protein E7619_02370 [Ruminococcaceae bacterium]|nr:hypothetical protein [Oscillospiraceae bacterium]